MSARADLCGGAIRNDRPYRDLSEWTQLFRQDDLLFLMYQWALDLFHCVDR